MWIVNQERTLLVHRFLYSMSSWPAVSIHWWFSQSELLHWYILNRYDIIITSPLYYSSSLIIGRNTVCVSCPAGYYCPYTDRDEVNACQLGSYSVGRQSSCTLCPAGRLDIIFPGIRYISLSTEFWNLIMLVISIKNILKFSSIYISNLIANIVISLLLSPYSIAYWSPNVLLILVVMFAAGPVQVLTLPDSWHVIRANTPPVTSRHVHPALQDIIAQISVEEECEISI